jgi:hypothetical protein
MQLKLIFRPILNIKYSRSHHIAASDVFSLLLCVQYRSSSRLTGLKLLRQILITILTHDQIFPSNPAVSNRSRREGCQCLLYERPCPWWHRQNNSAAIWISGRIWRGSSVQQILSCLFAVKAPSLFLLCCINCWHKLVRKINIVKIRQ